jgi:uncharacterized protein with PQ loop repeat
MSCVHTFLRQNPEEYPIRKPYPILPGIPLSMAANVFSLNWSKSKASDGMNFLKFVAFESSMARFPLSAIFLNQSDDLSSSLKARPVGQTNRTIVMTAFVCRRYFIENIKITRKAEKMSVECNLYCDEQILLTYDG